MSLRIIRSQMFFKIGALKYFTIFIGKHLCWSLFSYTGLQLYLQEPSTQMFSCEYCQTLKNTFFTKHLQWLLLKIIYHHRIYQHNPHPKIL